MLAVILAAAVMAAQPALAVKPLETGFADDAYLEGAPTRDQWLDRTVSAGGTVVRLTPSWAAIAPATPRSGFDATDPADPQYNWATPDRAVRDAHARGLDVLITLFQAPAWAEAPHRPRTANPGTWKPDPAALGAFARAAAQRYSGDFPDPANPGRPLPRVSLWQVWNEPNLTTYLAPQWVKRKGRFSAWSPNRYRAMLNAAYASIKDVHRDNLVGTAGTAPYGDPDPGGRRITPVLFLRDLLCLRGRQLKGAPCPDPAHFDALAHHPYGVGGPEQHALNPEDAAVPDLGKLTSVVSAARRSGRVLPRTPKTLWVTEISWDSNPPDPQGVPAQTHARWLEESFYVLWRQGVNLVTWFQIRDQDASNGYPNSNQSGVYLRDGTPKLALQAFKFPFVVERSGRSTIVWGKAPSGGEVTVQQRVGSAWKTTWRGRTGQSNLFTGRLKSPQKGLYRAVQGNLTSLTWHFLSKRGVD